MYIRLSDKEYPVTESMIKRENPQTTFPTPFRPTANYAPVLSSPNPSYNMETQWVREGSPMFDGINWMQTWEVIDFTQEEIENRPPPIKYIPPEVTMRQARLALLDAGLLSSIVPAINNLPEELRERALIEWEYSSAVLRNGPMVSILGPLLSLSEEDIDNLFIAASQK